MTTKQANQLPTTEQLATLTARLVASDIIPKLIDCDLMFRAALDYWRGCEKFLAERNDLEAQATRNREASTATTAEQLEGVPRPAEWPTKLSWIQTNLFDGKRDKLRAYVAFWSAKDRPAHLVGTVESYIDPLVESGVSEAYFPAFVRHWKEWRANQISAARREAGTKGQSKLKEKKEGDTKKKPLTRKAPKKTRRLLK